MNLEILKSNANSFRTAANRCLEMRKISDTMFESLVLPGIINFTFAAELYLKYLLVRQKTQPINKSHDLYGLFDKLDDKTKCAIRNEVNISELELLSLLEKNSKLFCKLRYFHEKNDGFSVDLGFLTKFVDALEKEI